MDFLGTTPTKINRGYIATASAVEHLASVLLGVNVCGRVLDRVAVAESRVRLLVRALVRVRLRVIVRVFTGVL